MIKDNNPNTNLLTRKKEYLKLKKFILLSLIPLIITASIAKTKNDVLQVSINEKYDGSDYYATYRYGKIYFCKSSEESVLRQIATPEDIIVVDKRDEKDPDIVIINSYRINNPAVMDEILTAIMKYEEQFPSKWDRTFSSMKTEWIAHNVFYYLHQQRHRTTDVDLNNEQEDLFSDISLKKIYTLVKTSIDE